MTKTNRDSLSNKMSQQVLIMLYATEYNQSMHYLPKMAT